MGASGKISDDQVISQRLLRSRCHIPLVAPGAGGCPRGPQPAEQWPDGVTLHVSLGFPECLSDEDEPEDTNLEQTCERSSFCGDTEEKLDIWAQVRFCSS